MFWKEKVEQFDTSTKVSPVCVCGKAFWLRRKEKKRKGKKKKKKSCVPNVPKSVLGIGLKNNEIFQCFFLLSQDSGSAIVNMLIMICQELITIKMK